MIKNLPQNYHEFGSGWYRNIDFIKESNAFRKVIDSSKKENDIQKYIKDNEKWFIPASILKDYDFGHHMAYLVPEQPLGSQYRVDYMLLGKNSIGYHIILVEFENANVDYRIRSANSESESVRKGLTQIRDWQVWMDDNRSYFLNYPGLSEIAGNIPSWGIKYCLVVGRRDRMDEISNNLRRKTMYDKPGLSIISYDRLVENVSRLQNGF